MRKHILNAAKPALLLGLLLLAANLLPESALRAASLPTPIAEKPALWDAPTRPPPLKLPPPRTGFIPPPMDLSHLKGDRMPEGVRAAALPSKWDWRDQGKVTLVKDQGPCGSCYAFAAIANIESKLLIDGAGTYDFSENNAKECNWEELNNYQYPPGNPWGSCDGGNYFMLANLFSQKGTVLESCDPYVPNDVNCNDTCPYIKTLLDWRIIAGSVPSTDVLKGYIYNYGPIDASMYAGAGPGDAWYEEFVNYDGSYTLYYPGTEDTNHDVLIVGWDDGLTHAGGTGGWIVKNSWGTGWGDNGYFYIAYGSASIGKYSSFMYDWQDYDPNGDIMYYDEAGWMGYSWGYGDTTGWGLCKFIPPSDTYVTRVEFWTTDATTDVDVYIYDDFDGTAPSSLLWSSLDHSFAEAGYHGVAVNPPLAVTGGDDVIAVVKFTNPGQYPIPIDVDGPNETGRTYVSPSGSDGSWYDLGVGENADVAIRLRTSSAAGAPTPTPTPTQTPTLTPTQTPTPTGTPPTGTVTPPAFRAHLPIILKAWPPTPTPTPTVTPTTTLTPTPTTVTLSSIADACILEGYPGENVGHTIDMWAGYDDYLDPDGEIVRSLVRFDLSGLPPSAQINNATLRLYLIVSWDYPNRSRTITTHRIGSDWAEMTVTWNNKPSCLEAYGSNSVQEGAWGWYDFDVIALVQAWVNGSQPNYGIMIRGPEHSGPDSSWRGFSTREGPHPPQLVIDYTGSAASAAPTGTATPVAPSESILSTMGATGRGGHRPWWDAGRRLDILTR